MSAYDVDYFLHRLSTDPVFRSGIIADDEAVWDVSGLTDDEQAAVREGRIADLYAQGVNAFMLHHLLRFSVGGLTLDRYTAQMSLERQD